MGSASGRCTPGASGWGDLAAGNHRNGYSQKSVTLADERVVLDIPRDRNGPFDPLLIPKYARRYPGFDDKIIALYAQGMSTRDIQAHIEEIYGITVSPSLVSAVTEAMLPSRNWRYNSGSGSCAKTDFSNWLTHRIQDRPARSACRRVNPTARTPHALHEFPNEQVQQP